ncbi:LacI family transcriptional regulator, partial [Colidextribacter sp. OB.20]
MGKQATIRDVAKLAGVSLATVSRVLNESDYPVREELRQKVRAAVEELDYVPNAVARSLRREAVKDIGLVIPNVSNPFYLQTMLGVNDVLSKNECSMILCNTLRDVEQERGCLRQLYERQT